MTQTHKEATCHDLIFIRHGAKVALVVKKPPADAGDIRDVGSSLGQEDALEEATAAHSGILAWRSPWAEELGRLPSIASQGQTQLK